MTEHTFQISLLDAACQRLAGVERLPAAHETWVALPKSYARKTGKSYPLLIVLDARSIFGSAIEMSRLMAETTEIHETIVIGVHAPVSEDFGSFTSFLMADLLPACAARYRITAGMILLFGHGVSGAFAVHAALAGPKGIDQFIAATPDAVLTDAVLKNMSNAYQHGARRQLVLACGASSSAGDSQSELRKSIIAGIERISDGVIQVSSRHLPSPTTASAVIPALAHGLRTLLATGGVYGKAIVPMRKPLVQKTLSLLAPLIRKIKPAAPSSDDPANPWLMRSRGMQRNFEIFASLPASAARSPGRRYPALLVLDANIEFSTAAEAAARMAASGDIEEIIVIGIGVPRAEGTVEFGFRRFEEFSPPPDGYKFDDDLGRIFLSLFAVRGQDGRQRIGQAPPFYRFLTVELLPKLLASLPLDPAQLGLLGHSAGGTFVGYALAQADSPFTRYIGVSPGIGISGSWLQRYPRKGHSPARVHLSLGGEELKNAFNDIAGIPATEEYCKTLARDTALSTRFECFDGETHSSVYPSAVVSALKQLYPVEAK